jgi:hypothetical protein
LQYAGVDIRRGDDGTVIVASFLLADEEPPPDWFFINAADGCRLTR